MKPALLILTANLVPWVVPLAVKFGPWAVAWIAGSILAAWFFHRICIFNKRHFKP